MDFTYKSYASLIDSLKKKQYTFCNYENYLRNDKCVIMRHDIDFSLEQALHLAQIEHFEGVKSTYFVLVSSDFYNPASSSSYNSLRKIAELGHTIGLHFDETAYSYSKNTIEYYIRKEARILSELTNMNINTFSLHRPNKVILETDLDVPGLINAYGSVFFHEFKYLSDSRRFWREPVEKIISSGEYNRLHILTHAFWYHQNNVSLEKNINVFINSAAADRIKALKENITDLERIINYEHWVE